MQKEIWKKAEGYIGYYLVSSLGNIKSTRGKNDLILKSYTSNSGYLFVVLFKNSIYIHKLVAIAFLNHKPDGYNIVIDHIDNNKSNNHVDNLQLITHRENVTKNRFRKNYSSKYIGVCWDKSANKWRSRILINGKRKYLGLFKYELEAALAYQNELNNLI